MNYDEYNPDHGYDIPFCPVCGQTECECPPEPLTKLRSLLEQADAQQAIEDKRLVEALNKTMKTPTPNTPEWTDSHSESVWPTIDDQNRFWQDQSAISAMHSIVKYCTSSILAAMVDEWLDEVEQPVYLQLAQIALDEGIRNCGLNELACYAAGDGHPTKVIQRWKAAGLRFPDGTSDDNG